MSPACVHLVLVFAAASFPSASLLPRSARQDQPPPPCECVPYYQCDADNVIKTDGADLIDVRFKACENDFDVCCEAPLDADKVSPGPHTEVAPTEHEGEGNEAASTPLKEVGAGTKPPLHEGCHEVTQAPHNEDSHEVTQPPHNDSHEVVHPSNEGTPCKCVPYHQCETSNIYNNTFILDTRTHSCELVDEVCCIKPQESEEQKPACICTPFFLCDKNDYIIEDGKGALDSRLSCPGDTEICCYPKKSTEEPPVDGHDETSVEDPSNEVVYSHIPAPKPAKKPGCGHVTPCEEVEFAEAYKITGPEGSAVPTGFGEFPWMVAIFRGEELICGGSLIHPSAILTAAHCTLKSPEKGGLKVRVGEWDLERESEPVPHQERSVVEVVKHQHFNPSNLHNDVALLLLEEPIQINDAVDIVCYKDTNHTYGADCIATGWGQTTFGKPTGLQSILKQVNLPIVENNECQERLRKTRLGKYFKLHDGFVCAGGIPDHDTCTGDGGGPLVCPQPDGSYTQVGIVAWGIGCGNDTPAVYASVHHYHHWIQNHLRLL